MKNWKSPLVGLVTLALIVPCASFAAGKVGKKSKNRKTEVKQEQVRIPLAIQIFDPKKIESKELGIGKVMIPLRTIGRNLVPNSLSAQALPKDSNLVAVNDSNQVAPKDGKLVVKTTAVETNEKNTSAASEIAKANPVDAKTAYDAVDTKAAVATIPVVDTVVVTKNVVSKKSDALPAARKNHYMNLSELSATIYQLKVTRNPQGEIILGGSIHKACISTFRSQLQTSQSFPQAFSPEQVGFVVRYSQSLEKCLADNAALNGSDPADYVELAERLKPTRGAKEIVLVSENESRSLGNPTLWVSEVLDGSAAYRTADEENKLAEEAQKKSAKSFLSEKCGDDEGSLDSQFKKLEDVRAFISNDEYDKKLADLNTAKVAAEKSAVEGDIQALQAQVESAATQAEFDAAEKDTFAFLNSHDLTRDEKSDLAKVLETSALSRLLIAEASLDDTSPSKRKRSSTRSNKLVYKKAKATLNLALKIKGIDQETRDELKETLKAVNTDQMNQLALTEGAQSSEFQKMLSAQLKTNADMASYTCYNMRYMSQCAEAKSNLSRLQQLQQEAVRTTAAQQAQAMNQYMAPVNISSGLNQWAGTQNRNSLLF